MTTTLLVLLFLAAIGLVVYTFAGYPLVIANLAEPERGPTSGTSQFAVTVVIAAFNGQPWLERRIDNLLQQDYPEDRLRIVVVDDGSTDGTRELLERLAQHPRVDALFCENNAGKAAALNVGLAAVETELVVMTDVRQEFAPDVISTLVSHFHDPGVGAVTGNLVFRSSSQPDAQGGYWDLEKSIRESESRYRSTVGVTGAVYAARRALIEPLPSGLILDDVLIPMRIVRAGYRVKFEVNAIAYDDLSQTLTEEFHRKVRTLAGNWQILAEAPWLMSPGSNPIFFEYVSHKFLRLIAPWALAVTLLVAYLLRDMALFGGYFAIGIALMVLAGLGALLYQARIQLPLLTQLMGFALLNSAALVGTWRFFVGRGRNLWRSH